MRELVTTLILTATVTLAYADPPLPGYERVVDVSNLDPYARLYAYRQYQKDRRAALRAKYQAGVAAAKAQQEKKQANTKPATTAESLFAQKMTERHATE